MLKKEFLRCSICFKFLGIGEIIETFYTFRAEGEGLSSDVC